MVEYTDSALVTSSIVTSVPRSGQTASGYGSKISTRYMVKYAGRWHRVYSMVYGNSGSAYIIVKGRNLFLDTDTEYALEKAYESLGGQ